MTRRFWTPEEDAILKSLCDGTISYEEIAIRLNRPRYGAIGRAKCLGFQNNYNPRLYTKDETFFQTPNPINSYHAGYISADGSVDWGQHSVRWSCEEGDRIALETFKEVTKYTGKIGFKLNTHGLGKNPSRQNYLDVYAASQWCEDLHRNFGIVPGKTHCLAPPNTVNDLLNSCFMLGYLDGDGSVSFTESGSWAISVTSSSPRVLEFIKAFCDRHFHHLYHSHYSVVHHYDQHYVYTIKGYRAIHLFDLMRSLPVPKLARKWENPEILRVIDARKARQPDLFKPGMELSFDETGTLRRHAQVESLELYDPGEPLLTAA